MTSKPKSRFWRVFAAAWLLLSLLAAAWAIATPIGGSPDEPAHLIKAASVVRGQLVGDHSADGQVVEVPEYVAFSKEQTCYAFRADVSADCITEVPGDPSRLVKAPTTAGLYNPVYYVIVGWPSVLAQDSSGIYWMRVASALATSLFLALAFALVATWRRPTLPLLGLAIAITPMVLFLNGTVNPNALEIAATLATFVGLLTVLREPNASKLATRSAIIFAAAALAANMRGLSLLWLAVAIVAPFVLVGWGGVVALAKKRPVQLAVAGTAVAMIAAAVWLAATNSLGVGIPADPAGRIPGAPGIGTPPLTGFVWNLVSTFQYAEGMVGVFGWLDTPAPLLVFFVWSVLAGGLLLLAVILLRGRNLVLVAVLVGAVILLPPILQGIYVTSGGVIWQGRYILPVFVCAVVAVAAVLSDRVPLEGAIATRLVTIVLGLWVVAQFISFAAALRRYAVGADAGWLDILSPKWSPPGGIVLSLGAFALILAISAVSLVLLLRQRPEASSTIEESRAKPGPSRMRADD